MAGLVPAIPMRRNAALQAIEITGTRPVMTGAGLPLLDESTSQDEATMGANLRLEAQAKVHNLCAMKLHTITTPVVMTCDGR
jgi:hypothetical protein